VIPEGIVPKKVSVRTRERKQNLKTGRCQNAQKNKKKREKGRNVHGLKSICLKQEREEGQEVESSINTKTLIRVRKKGKAAKVGL